MSWISKTWHGGPRVRMDSLSPGARFVTITGSVYTLKRKHAFEGLYVVTRGDLETLMIESAEVVALRKLRAALGEEFAPWL